MVVYRAKNVRIVSMSQYLWTWLYIYIHSADPRYLGALRKTVLGGGVDENGWVAFVRVSIRLESRSRKALEKQYLFRGSYKLCVFFFFVFFFFK